MLDRIFAEKKYSLGLHCFNENGLHSISSPSENASDLRRLQRVIRERASDVGYGMIELARSIKYRPEKPNGEYGERI